MVCPSSSTPRNIASPFALVSLGQDAGAQGWLGKVGLGYDYQFMGNFVIGVFADADWSNIGGQYSMNTLAYRCSSSRCFEPYRPIQARLFLVRWRSSGLHSSSGAFDLL